MNALQKELQDFRIYKSEEGVTTYYKREGNVTRGMCTYDDNEHALFNWSFPTFAEFKKYADKFMDAVLPTYTGAKA